MKTSALRWLLSALCLLSSVLWLPAATYTVTAYCPCGKCCGRWAGGPTASGVRPQAGVTLAAPRSIPFGTRLHLPGLGPRIVQDRTARRYDGRLDVFMRTHAEALRFGIRRITLP